MRYYKLTTVLIFSFTTNVFALELITPSEDIAMQEINQQYDINSLLISGNDKLGHYNKKEYEHTSLAVDIDNYKDSYQKEMKSLTGIVISQVNVDEFFSELQALVLKIDKLERKYIQEGGALKEEYQAILNDGKKLKQLRSEKNIKLTDLKQKVIDRLTSELANPNSVKNLSVSSSAVCSKFQSISDCLNDNENIIITNAKKSDNFLNERSVLLSYEIVNASMDLHGGLSYTAQMSFKPSYNNKIESILNEKFGLKSATLTLTSNVNADWYIDGNKVGKGKEITQEVSLGKHGILASYNSLKQSSIEVIEKNGVFSYSFSVKKPIKKTDASVKLNSNKESKTTSYVPFVKPIIKLKPDSQKVETGEEKDYLYYMGIEPAPKKQDSFL